MNKQLAKINNSSKDVTRKLFGYHFWRKTLIFLLYFLVAWTFTKVPYYMQFDINGDSDYERGGLTGSINLYYWVKGFESTKLHSPACSFLLLHIAFGSTVLVMSALCLMRSSWRRKYGKYFFASAILLGVHTIPAAWTMRTDFTKYLFTFTCLWSVGWSIKGYITLHNYANDPVKAERNLALQYAAITFGAYGAGFAESFGIASKFVYHAKYGEFEKFTELDPRFGNSIYDKVPEKVGFTLFFLWVGIVWAWWPLRLMNIDISSFENAAEMVSDASEEYGPDDNSHWIKKEEADDNKMTVIRRILELRHQGLADETIIEQLPQAEQYLPLKVHSNAENAWSIAMEKC